MIRLFALLLIGFIPLAKSGVGDTYYCDTEHKILIEDNKLVKYLGERFMFKWDKKNEHEFIVFGETGEQRFRNQQFGLDFSVPKHEVFDATSYEFPSRSRAYFNAGRFRYVELSRNPHPKEYMEVVGIIANCSKFK